MSDVKCLLMLPPLPSQSVLKHTAVAAVVPAAAAALDLSGEFCKGENGVFVLTSAPAASKKFFGGAVEVEKRRENAGRLPAQTYSGRVRWRTLIGRKGATFVRFFIVRLNRCGSCELKSPLQGKS